MQRQRYLLTVFIVAACISNTRGQVAEMDSPDTIRIENEWLLLEFDARNMSFAVSSKAAGLKFIERGTLRGQSGRARRGVAGNPKWGSGQAVQVEHGSGQVDSLMLFPRLPFVVLVSTLANGTGESTTLDRIRPVRMTLGANKQADELRALGTAGLTGVARESNPGSYSYLAVADPGSRAGVVAGWLTHERGSGILFSDIENGKAVVDARIDYGRLLIEPGETVELETLLVGYFEDARLGLEAYADAIARHDDIELPPQPTVYCTWYHAGASNERDLLKNAAFAKEHLVPYGFSVVQIDDKWQAGEKLEGPRKNFTTHRVDGPYPAGMRQTAEKLTQLGLVPGIWFMPFAGTWNDPFFADKQDLFAQEDGKPYEVPWGGTCFDLTNPKTRDYVYSVAHRIARDWGYKYFKLDGLWTGMATGMCYVNTGYKEDHLGATVLHDPHKTHVQAYRDGLKLVREAAGRDVFILGCNVAQNMRVLGASFGLVDAMRIGPDNGRRWSQICRGPFSGSNMYFLHGRVWYNDPDPIYVRDSVPLEHARVLTSWVTLTGQLNAGSIQYEDLSAERLRLLQRTMPAHGLKPRPVDLFEESIPRIWLLTDERGSSRCDVIGLFNWDEKEDVQIERSLEEIGLASAKAYVGFDYWANDFVEPFGGKLKARLPAASCRILAARPVSAVPQVVSTSRHITQGVVDLLEDKWDAHTGTLSGLSKVVANDPYELRIVAMGRVEAWRAADAAVSPEDIEAGVKIRLVEQEGWKLRITIDSPESRDIRWSVEFASTR